MNIRLATPEDAPAIAAIYAPIVLGTAISFELDAPSADEMRGRIVTTLAAFPWLVAEDDRGVSGYAYAGKHRERAAYRWSVDTTAYVRPDCHRRGIAKALYARLLSVLADRGFYQAFAGIALPNDASVALHESVGFRPIGVYRRVGFKLDAWRDVGWWQRALRDDDDAPPGPA